MRWLRFAVAGEFQRAVVGDADRVLVDLVVHLFQVQHHQIGGVQQLVDHRIVAAHEAIGVRAGIDAFGVAGAEPVAHEFCLQDRLAAGRGHAAAGGVHEVAVGHRVFHQLFNGHFFAAVGIPCRGYGNRGSASGSPEEDDKADPARRRCRRIRRSGCDQLLTFAPSVAGKFF